MRKGLLKEPCRRGNCWPLRHNWGLRRCGITHFQLGVVTWNYETHLRTRPRSMCCTMSQSCQSFHSQANIEQWVVGSVKTLIVFESWVYEAIGTGRDFYICTDQGLGEMSLWLNPHLQFPDETNPWSEIQKLETWVRFFMVLPLLLCFSVSEKGKSLDEQELGTWI